MKRILVLFAAILAEGPLHAQSTFDAAAIRPVKGPVTHSSDPVIKGRTVTSVADKLHDFIEWAYSIRGENILGGPAWVSADSFDLEAKSEGDGPLTLAQARAMMRTLLADRFHLIVHREMQDTPVYNLVPGKDGPKLKTAPPDARGFSTTGTATGIHIEAKRGTMDQLAQQLTGFAGRAVLDKTGLTGAYAFTLDFYPSLTPPTDVTTPVVFDAVKEQLALKLEPSIAPIEKLIIDRAGKPTEN